VSTQHPTSHDLEVALAGQVYFAKRVTVVDPKHADFHREIDLLLTEWEETRATEVLTARHRRTIELSTDGAAPAELDN
jgi:hypothetical protein